MRRNYFAVPKLFATEMIRDTRQMVMVRCIRQCLCSEHIGGTPGAAHVL